MNLNIYVSPKYYTSVNDVEIQFHKKKVRKILYDMDFVTVFIRGKYALTPYSYDVNENIIIYYNKDERVIGFEIPFENNKIILNGDNFNHRNRTMILNWFANHSYYNDELLITDYKIRHMILNISILFESEDKNKADTIIFV